MPCSFTSPLQIALYHHKLAGKCCEPVKNADATEIGDLAEGLRQFCLKHALSGLAAPQVGVYLQLAVLRLPDGQFETLINPRVVNMGARDLLEPETCIAIPGASPRIWRSEMVQVRSDPDVSRVRTYTGALARAALHEIDHLDGIYFMDRCQTPGKIAALQAYARWLKSKRKM